MIVGPSEDNIMPVVKLLHYTDNMWSVKVKKRAYLVRPVYFVILSIVLLVGGYFCRSYGSFTDSGTDLDSNPIPVVGS